MGMSKPYVQSSMFPCLPFSRASFTPTYRIVWLVEEYQGSSAIGWQVVGHLVAGLVEYRYVPELEGELVRRLLRLKVWRSVLGVSMSGSWMETSDTRHVQPRQIWN